jgi:hypothetical protein
VSDVIPLEWLRSARIDPIDETNLDKVSNEIRLERPNGLDQSVGIERAIDISTEANKNNADSKGTVVPCR